MIDSERRLFLERILENFCNARKRGEMRLSKIYFLANADNEQYTNIDYLIMLVCAVIKNLNARAKEHTRTEKTRNENLGLAFHQKKKKKKNIN